MRPEDVPAEWVDKAADEILAASFGQELPESPDYLARHTLAAVLPEIQAQSWDEAARVVHAEARHQTELAGRRSLGAEYTAQRLLVIEKVLRDRAARPTAATEEATDG